MTPTPVLSRTTTAVDGSTAGRTVGIREAARLSGVPPHTLRWYEQIGLVPGIRRSTAGRRCYSRPDLRWIGILRALRDTGMSVAALQDLAEHRRADRADRAVLVVRLHRARVLALMLRLQSSLGVLDSIEAELARPPSGGPGDGRPAPAGDRAGVPGRVDGRGGGAAGVLGAGEHLPTGERVLLTGPPPPRRSPC